MRVSDLTEGRTDPLVVVICAAPLLCEALSSALDGIAAVRQFPASRGDTAGLLSSVRPDAVVVDSDDEAEAAAAFAAGDDAPVVHVSYRANTLRVFADGFWREPARAVATPEAVRNVIVGHLAGRRTAV